MNKLQAHANETLTDATPTAPNGAPDGPTAPPVGPEAPEATPGAAAPVVGHLGAPSAPPAAPTGLEAAAVQALTGEPHAWTQTQWCKRCGVDVLPIGRGECPRCHSALRLNFRARRHPVNVLRRDALLAKFVAEYRPETQRLQSLCEQLAGVTEQLEVLKPGSQEHARLVQLSQTLGAALEASRPATPREQVGPVDDDALIARLSESLRFLLRAKQFDREPGCSHPECQDGSCRHVDRSAGAAAPVAGPPVKVEPTADAAPEPCAYCQCTPCVGREHPAYSALHYHDPEEARRRGEQETAEMFESLRRARRGGDPYVR